MVSSCCILIVVVFFDADDAPIIAPTPPPKTAPAALLPKRLPVDVFVSLVYSVKINQQTMFYFMG